MIGNENEKTNRLTYVDQSLINHINVRIFEMDVEDMMKVVDIKNSLLMVNTYKGSAVKRDMTMRRISVYIELVGIANTFTNSIMLLLSGYNKPKDSFRTWKYRPSEFKSRRRNSISKVLHSECGLHFH